MNMEEEMMSPTTRLAQQDVMSPLEDLELDGMDVGMMSEDETLKTTTPGMSDILIYILHVTRPTLLIHWIYESKFPSFLLISVETFGSVADKSGKSHKSFS